MRMEERNSRLESSLREYVVPAYDELEADLLSSASRAGLR